MKTRLLIIFFVAAIFGDTLTIERVKDGDTYLLSTGQTVRLIGIDTPEKHNSKKLEKDIDRYSIKAESMVLMGKLSTEYARKLVQGQKVCLKYGRKKIDYYDRLLAYVFIVGDSISINERLILEGYAKTFEKYPFPEMPEYLKAEQQAQKELKGLWKLYPQFMKAFTTD